VLEYDLSACLDQLKRIEAAPDGAPVLAQIGWIGCTWCTWCMRLEVGWGGALFKAFPRFLRALFFLLNIRTEENTGSRQGDHVGLRVGV
jgi:hypothetical protein